MAAKTFLATATYTSSTASAAFAFATGCRPSLHTYLSGTTATMVTTGVWPTAAMCCTSRLSGLR